MGRSGHVGRMVVAFLALAVCSSDLLAGLKLPYIISDNMVLQRDKPVRIWGSGDDGTEVTVRFKQQKRRCLVKGGKWLLELASEKAGGPFEMTITHGAETRTIRNILVGEVWQASGQSNMEWTIMGETHKEETLKRPPNDMIRLFKQQRQVGVEPMDDTLPAAWAPDSSTSRRHFSAVAYFFACDLQEALGVPVGVSLACDGGTKTQYWTPIEAFQSDPQSRTVLDQARRGKGNLGELKTKYEAAKAEFLRKRKAGEKTGPYPTFYGRVPCAYYNGMIHPIRYYKIRGVIWYQGERNSLSTRDAYEYRTYFPLMIRQWRRVFQAPELPFLFVQLPKMAVRDPRDAPVTRESQTWTSMNVKNTGMVVSLDVGEPGLHPKLKRPIGQRLAKVALAKVYGHEVEYGGPMYKSAKVERSKVIISFDHVGEGLMSKDGKPLTEFMLCGEDQNFVPAEASIVGETVVVSSVQVGSPVAVRFAWKNAPFTNLLGKNALPVGPFRTDDFALPEKNPEEKK